MRERFLLRLPTTHFQNQHLGDHWVGRRNNRFVFKVSFLAATKSFTLIKGRALSSDIVWFTPVSVLSSHMNKVAGGWSRLLRDYLVLQLTSTESGLQTSGVPLVLGDGQSCLLYAKLGMLLSDGDGLRIALQWMGQGCTKPCWRHNNVLKKGSALAQHHADYVEISCSDPAKFRAWQENDFRDAIDMLVEAHARHGRGVLTATKLGDIQKAFGFRPTAEGLLASTTLRSLTKFQEVTRYDWVHVFLQDGILTNEAWGVVSAAVHVGVCSQTDVHDFLKEEWVVPHHRRWHGRALHRVFNSYGARANETHDTIKCSASELLTLYGMLRHYAETRLAQHDELSGKLESFYLACKAVDILLCAKRFALSTSEASARLRTALERYLAVHKREYADSRVKPKTHWAFDVIEQLLVDTVLFDCFIIERLHLRVRNHAENVKNLRTYEASVLSGVVNEHSRLSQAALPGCGLLGKTVSAPFDPDVLLSDHMEVGGKTISVGDVVAHGHDVGRVMACCIADQDMFAIVERWQRISDLTPHSSTWDRRGSVRTVWRAADAQECLAWQEARNHTVTVIFM